MEHNKKRQIEQMLLSNRSAKEIKELWFVSDSLISGLRKELGLKKLLSGRPSNSVPIEEIRKLKAEGKTHREVAGLVGLTEKMVFKRLQSKEIPQDCEVCGATKDSCQIHGHHFDYMKEEVMWLCASCHSKIEKRTKNEKGHFSGKVHLSLSERIEFLEQRSQK